MPYREGACWGQGGAEVVEGVSVRELPLKGGFESPPPKNNRCPCLGAHRKAGGDARKFMGVVTGFETFSISR